MTTGEHDTELGQTAEDLGLRRLSGIWNGRLIHTLGGANRRPGPVREEEAAVYSLHSGVLHLPMLPYLRQLNPTINSPGLS